tara:strand:+ start:408 stop:1139 length:732 start_codon:yes stop_codon:yes gene_type:complete
MNNTSLNICILAAGKGTRMNSDLPKVLHKINNKPIIHFVIEKSLLLSPNQTILIIGYKNELVKQSVENFDISFAYQNEQKGTAHAIEQCMDYLKLCKGNTLVLSGDVPLISIKTLKKLINIHNKNHSLASILTAHIEDPSGYGRIIRDNNYSFKKIVEHKDASVDELKINEINSGIYIFNTEILCKNISLIKNNNNQGEYYLTDIFDFINNKDVSTYKTPNIDEINGINTIEQLENIENQMYE